MNIEYVYDIFETNNILEALVYLCVKKRIRGPYDVKIEKTDNNEIKVIIIKGNKFLSEIAEQFKNYNLIAFDDYYLKLEYDSNGD